MNTPTPRAGRVEEITSPSNPRIKSIKALAMKKNREREGVFLVEGRKLVTDALQQGWTIRTLLHSRRDIGGDGHNNQIAELAARIRARGGDILIINDKLLTSITRKDNPQTVVAVIEQAVSPLTAVVARKGECWVALDRVRDPEISAPLFEPLMRWVQRESFLWVIPPTRLRSRRFAQRWVPCFMWCWSRQRKLNS